MTRSLALAQLYWKQEDPGQSTAVLIGLGVLALALIVYQIIRQGGIKSGGSGAAEGPRERGGAAGAGGRGFSKGAFKRSARAAGLSEEEIAFLADYARAFGISEPEPLFSDRGRLEAFLRRVYKVIERSEESEAWTEERKALLFRIGERLGRQGGGEAAVRSTRQLGRNLPISFITSREESYPSVIVRSEPAGLAVEPVLDRFARPIRWRRGSRLTCFFYTESHQGYRFETRVAGWERFEDRELMLLQHSEELSPLPSRKHARRELQAPCSYYRVAVSTKRVGEKERAGARVEGAAVPGFIVDISAGGAGLRSLSPLQVGEYLKLEFDSGGEVQSAFAKVVRVSSLGSRGGIMHLRFVKVSRKSLNAILSYVHGFGE